MKDLVVLALSLLATTKAEKEKVYDLIINHPEFDASNVNEFFDLYKKIKASITDSEVEVAYKKAIIISQQSEKLGIKILVFSNPGYPALLKNIVDPPLVLYVKGDISVLQGDTIAVVGTREPSVYGKQQALSIASTLGAQGFVIVSGLAEGVDTQAHKGCLITRARTIAVLAHGLDTVYPAINKELAAQIIKTGGCLVSEYPPGTKASKHFFVLRNKIQSGLSRAVIVVETDIKGGTMHTADFCLRQNRKIACVDFSADPSQTKPAGNRELINGRGAVAIKNASDLQAFVSAIQKNAVSPQRIRIDDFFSGKSRSPAKPILHLASAVEIPPTEKLISLQQASKQSREFLNICAFMSEESINSQWFAKLYPNMAEIMANLVKYGFITLDATLGFFKLNLLFKPVIMATIGAKEYTYIVPALKAIAEFNALQAEESNFIVATAHHIDKLLENFPAAYRNEYAMYDLNIAKLFLKLGIYYKTDGASETAEYYLQFSYNIANTWSYEPNADQEFLLANMLQLATIYIINNKFLKANLILQNAEKFNAANLEQKPRADVALVRAFFKEKYQTHQASTEADQYGQLESFNSSGGQQVQSGPAAGHISIQLVYKSPNKKRKRGPK